MLIDCTKLLLLPLRLTDWALSSFMAMATCNPTVHSSFTMAHTSSVHPQDPSSLLSFRPIAASSTANIFSLCHPLILQRRGGRSTNWVDLKFGRECRDHLVVAALAAEIEVAEVVEENGEEGNGGTATSALPKIKKGKAALPLKRDRVSLSLSSCIALFSILSITILDMVLECDWWVLLHFRFFCCSSDLRGFNFRHCCLFMEMKYVLGLFLLFSSATSIGLANHFSVRPISMHSKGPGIMSQVINCFNVKWFM